MESNKTYISIFHITDDLLDEFGHVNNARYLDLYEQARWEVLDQNGLERKMITETMTGPVILEVTVRFSREIGPGEQVTIETKSRRKNDRIFYFDQEIKNRDGIRCSRAVFTAALFDMKERKMIRADKLWMKAFGFGDD